MLKQVSDVSNVEEEIIVFGSYNTKGELVKTCDDLILDGTISLE